jgi:hypothetical protein
LSQPDEQQGLARTRLESVSQCPRKGGRRWRRWSGARRFLRRLSSGQGAVAFIQRLTRDGGVGKAMGPCAGRGSLGMRRNERCLLGAGLTCPPVGGAGQHPQKSRRREEPRCSSTGQIRATSPPRRSHSEQRSLLHHCQAKSWRGLRWESFAARSDLDRTRRTADCWDDNGRDDLLCLPCRRHVLGPLHSSLPLTSHSTRRPAPRQCGRCDLPADVGASPTLASPFSMSCTRRAASLNSPHTGSSPKFSGSCSAYAGTTYSTPLSS